MKISSLQWKPKETGAYWDKRAKEVGSLKRAVSTGFYRRSETRLFRRYFGDLRDKRLLKLDLWNEINNTQILCWAAKKGAQVYGLDISEHIVKQAKERFKEMNLKGKLIVSDVRDIKFPNNYFDYVYSMGTIEHIPEYSQAIKEVYRVLKPGGLAIIGVPNKLDPFLRPLVVWLMTKIRKYPYAPEKSFTIFELEKELKKAGFKIQDKTGILFMPGIIRMIDVYFCRTFPLLNKAVGFSLRPFEFLENRFQFFARNGYLITCVGQK